MHVSIGIGIYCVRWDMLVYGSIINKVTNYIAKFVSVPQQTNWRPSCNNGDHCDTYFMQLTLFYKHDF